MLLNSLKLALYKLFIYYTSVLRDNWCDWKGEARAAVPNLCRKFTIATSSTRHCIFDRDINFFVE